MTERCDPTCCRPTIEELACQALARSRHAPPVLRELETWSLDGATRRQVASIAESIERRQIFSSGLLWDLHELGSFLDDEIGGRVVKVEMWSDHDCDVTGNTWTETYWPLDAQRLALIRGGLALLREAVGAVLDRREVDHILATGRKPPFELPQGSCR